MKSKIIIIALIALIAVGTASIALSQGRGRGGGPGGPPAESGSRMASVEKAEPAITEEQKAELKSLQESFVKETRPIRNDLELKSLELRHLWTAEKLDEEAIMAKSGEIADLKSQLQEKMTRHRLDVAKILPREQWARFLDREHRGPGLGSGRHGRGPGRRGRGFESPGRGRQGFGPGMGNMRGRRGGPGMGMPGMGMQWGRW